jgi:outer membrane protein assembly factor BamB
MRNALTRILIAAAALLPLVAAPGARAAEPETPAGETAARGNRPFRMGFTTLNRDLDRAKPLAMQDGAGFVVNSGLLVGAFDERWVGGMSLATQKVQWWYDGEVTMTAPPGSFGSSVVLGFRSGRVAKLEALTGKVQWVADLASFTERAFLLNGTTLYVLTAAQQLYALDFQTGRSLWMHDAGFPDGLTVRAGARPIFYENKIIFGVATGEIVAVDAATGKPQWRYNPAYNDARFHDVVGELVVRNNKLLLSRYDGLVASVDLASPVRALAWQEQLPGLTTSVFRNASYFVGGLNGDVYALDPDNNGRRLWRTVTGAPVTTITAGETTLFVAGTNGRVTALDAATGAILWHDQLGGSLASPPVLFENEIYYSTGLKSLYAYKLR